MAIRERLSDLMKAFHAEVLKLETPAKQAILVALKAAVTPLKDAARKLVDGTIIPHAEVTLGHLASAVPDFLRGDAKDLARALDAEIQARGPTWAKEGAHLAVTEFLVKPLDAHLNPPPAPVTTATVESAVAKAVKDALSAPPAPAPSPSV
jgi:hypothetical protein